MAKTHNKLSVGANVLQNPFLSYIAQYEEEAATQTFTRGNFVVWSTGRLTLATYPINNTNDAAGLAIEDGHNAAVGPSNLCKFIPVMDGVVFYANAMAAAGADHVLATGDVGLAATVTVDDLLGFVTTGVTDAFLDTAGAASAATITSLNSDIILPNEVQPRAEYGDTNARVGFVLAALSRAYND